MLRKYELRVTLWISMNKSNRKQELETPSKKKIPHTYSIGYL